jgi:hypothetical protein
MSLKLIGFYQTDDQAEHARDDLRSAGFDWNGIHVYHGQDAEQASTPIDRRVALEAARRHATALMLDTDEKVSAQALQILRRHHPMEMARANWPAHQWNGSMQPQRQEQTAQPEAQEASSPFAAAPQKDEPQVIFSAKRFVAEIAGDDRFRGRDWHDIEPFVQKEFERHYPNESWEEHEPAVMLGYTRAIDTRR